MAQRARVHQLVAPWKAYLLNGITSPAWLLASAVCRDVAGQGVKGGEVQSTYQVVGCQGGGHHDSIDACDCRNCQKVDCATDVPRAEGLHRQPPREMGATQNGELQAAAQNHF